MHDDVKPEIVQFVISYQLPIHAWHGMAERKANFGPMYMVEGEPCGRNLLM